MDFKAILHPTDFSEYSDAALRIASLMAAESGARLYIVHVDEALAPSALGFGGMGYTSESLVELQKENRERLNRIRPTKTGVDYETHFLVGVPDKEILEFAHRENIDLIVLGTHGRTGVARLLMGSIAESIVRHADCPVLTIKHSVAEATDPVVATTQPAQS